MDVLTYQATYYSLLPKISLTQAASLLPALVLQELLEQFSLLVPQGFCDTVQSLRESNRLY